jgi:outer membrane protein insertion porin family
MRSSPRRLGGGIRFGFPIDEKETLNFGLAIDQTTIDITPITLATPPSTSSSRPSTATRTSRCRRPCRGPGHPQQRDLHDQRGRPAGGVEVAIPGVDLTFYRLTYQNQHYFSLTKDLVLMVNAELGYANGLQGQTLAVLQELLRRRGRLGSRLRHGQSRSGRPAVSRYATRRDAQGGVQRRTADAAARVRQVASSGSILRCRQRVHDNRYTFSEEGLRMSVGLTAAWISPLGPLKFSYGQPINEKSNDKLQKFQFQMGTTF